MVKHRTHSIELKRQVPQEDLTGETLHGLSQPHAHSRKLIRIWVETYQADLLESYEARIAALQRLVGKQALELKLLKKAPLKKVPRAGLWPRAAATSGITALNVLPQPASQAVAPGPLRPVGWVRLSTVSKKLSEAEL